MNRVLLALAVLALTVMLVPLESASGALTWSSPEVIESNKGIDILPVALQASDGKLWLAWESFRLGRFDIFFKTLSGGVWSRTTALTLLSKGWNAAPALAQLNNGTIFVLWALNETGNFDIYYRTHTSGVWAPRVHLTSGAGDDTLLSAAVGRDGTLWLVWTRITATCCSVERQLYYKTLRNGVWSPDVKLTMDANWNIEPSVMVAKDGRVWVAWSKWQSAGNQYELFYKIYDGTSWGPETQLTSNNNWDNGPSVVQDRDGTIWVFWAREFPLPGFQFQDELFNKRSIDNGLTWSADTQMTFDPSQTSVIDDTMPAAVQAQDKFLWLFYVSDGLDASDFDIFSMKAGPITTVDLGISSTSATPPKLRPGGLVTVTVTVANYGDSSASTQLTATLSNTTSYNLGSQSVNLAPGASQTYTFTWNTAGVYPGRYKLLVNLTAAAGETVGNQGDNIAKGMVHVVPPGDVNMDGVVDILDIAIVAIAFGTRPGDAKWNPSADLNNDGKIDIIDIAICAKWFGTKT